MSVIHGWAATLGCPTCERPLTPIDTPNIQWDRAAVDLHCEHCSQRHTLTVTLRRRADHDRIRDTQAAALDHPTSPDRQRKART